MFQMHLMKIYELMKYLIDKIDILSKLHTY